MKKNKMIVGILMCCSFSVWAQAGSHACTAVMNACQAAGYYEGGGSTGKGIWSDCMNPLMQGKTVANLTIDPTVLQSCTGHSAMPTPPAGPPLQSQGEVAKFMQQQRQQVVPQAPPPRSPIFASPDNSGSSN